MTYEEYCLLLGAREIELYQLRKEIERLKDLLALPEAKPETPNSDGE